MGDVDPPDTAAIVPSKWPLSSAELATIAIAAHWQLEEVAYDLQRGRVSKNRLDTLADGLEALAEMMRRHPTTDEPR